MASPVHCVGSPETYETFNSHIQTYVLSFSHPLIGYGFWLLTPASLSIVTSLVRWKLYLNVYSTTSGTGCISPYPAPAMLISNAVTSQGAVDTPMHIYGSNLLANPFPQIGPYYEVSQQRPALLIWQTPVSMLWAMPKNECKNSKIFKIFIEKYKINYNN